MPNLESLFNVFFPHWVRNPDTKFGVSLHFINVTSLIPSLAPEIAPWLVPRLAPGLGVGSVPSLALGLVLNLHQV